MRRLKHGIFAVVLLALGAGVAMADGITFDDAYASLGDGGDPSTYYSAEGVTIGGDNAGLWGGISNGNPGGWGLEGTNGPAFLGCNDGDFCSPTFTFSTPVDDFSLDIGLANNWSAGFTVSGYMNDSLVDSLTLTINHGVSGGTWDTFALTGDVNQVVVSSSFVSPGFAFGLDNVQFQSAGAASPEPATFSMLLFGAIAIGFVSLRRRKANSPVAE